MKAQKNTKKNAGMGMEIRNPNEIRLVLYSRQSEERLCRVFHICSKLGEGAFSTVYEAYHEESFRGVLKQYGQKGESADSVDPLLAPYFLLRETLQKGKSQDLANFLPLYEIYEEEGQKGSFWIWMPAARVVSFADLCRSIRQSSKTASEVLELLLTAVGSLLRGVQSLHESGMVHRDLKPANFGIRKHNDTYLSQGVCLYDVESICSVYKPGLIVTGTPGYMEPEALWEDPSNQTDLYSIGAILYHALIFTEEDSEHGRTPDGNPAGCTFGAVYAELKNSRLFADPALKNASRLLRQLAQMISRALAPRARRYPCAELMLEDLNAILSRVRQMTRRKKQQSAVISLERLFQASSSSRLRGLEPLRHLHAHLFELPVGRQNPRLNGKTRRENRVMLIGFGIFSELVIDLLLQMIQFEENPVEILIVSEDPEEFERYVKGRPGLRDFFGLIYETPFGTVKKSVPANASYGTIRFYPLHLDFIGDTLFDLPGRLQKDVLHSDSVFIALARDARNRNLAASLSDLCAQENVLCDIRFHQQFPEGPYELAVWQENEKEPDFTRSSMEAMPIRTDAKFSKDEEKLCRLLDELAFNAHLLWQRQSMPDLEAARREFEDPYAYYSSLCTAMTIPAKLAGFDLTLDLQNPQDVLSEFRKRLSDPAYAQARQNLVCAEHRRWIVEKLCRGWSRLDDLDACIPGRTYDHHEHHLLLVDSTPSLTLQNGIWKEESMWDQADEAHLALLDDLDRRSVEVHQHHLRKARDVRASATPFSLGLEELEPIARANETVWSAFFAWKSCVLEIWNGEQKASGPYKKHTGILKKALAKLDPAQAVRAADILNRFEQSFWPLAACHDYKDWKINDLVLIDEIPFLLDFSSEHQIWMELRLEYVEDILHTLFAFEPRQLRMVCAPKNQEEAKRDYALAVQIARLMRTRHQSLQIDLVLLNEGDSTAFLPISSSRCGPVYTETEMDGEVPVYILNPDCSDEALDRVSDRNKTEESGSIENDAEAFVSKPSVLARMFVQSFEKTGPAGSLLEGLVQSGKANRLNTVKSLQEDNLDPDLSDCPERDSLQPECLNERPCMQDEEVMNWLGLKTGQPAFAHYEGDEELWAIYSENPAAWTSLCELLSALSVHISPIVFDDHALAPAHERMQVYTLPEACRPALKRIMDALKQAHLIEEESGLYSRYVESLEFRVTSPFDLKESFARLFWNFRLVMDEHTVQIEKAANREVKVAPDPLDLETSRLEEELSRLESQYSPEIVSSCRACLERLIQKRLLISSGWTKPLEPGAPLRFVSHRLKQLLSDPAAILRARLVSHLHMTSKYDDFMGGMSFESREGDLSLDRPAKFDCLLVKGLRSVFVRVIDAANPPSPADLKTIDQLMARGHGLCRMVYVLCSPYACTRREEPVQRDALERAGDLDYVYFLSAGAIGEPDMLENLPEKIVEAFK